MLFLLRFLKSLAVIEILLKNVWNILNLLEKGLEYMKDINIGFEVNVKKQSLKNIMVLVKTQAGLKNMYRLVSEAHIKYFGNKKARIPKSVLVENREGLIIGSSLTAHFMNTGELVDLYLRHDLEKLEEAAKFYDYIELLPKSTYNELIEKDGTGALGSYEEVEKMNKYFYDLGKRLGILVTASSNVHCLELYTVPLPYNKIDLIISSFSSR